MSWAASVEYSDIVLSDNCCSHFPSALSNYNQQSVNHAFVRFYACLSGEGKHFQHWL